MKFAIQYMRKAVQRKAKFDIMDLNTIKVLFFLSVHISDYFFVINNLLIHISETYYELEFN